MRTVSASEAKATLLGLLDAVERGESVTVTRRGKAIARIIPEEDAARTKRTLSVERLRELRKRMPSFTADEVGDMIREGRKY